MNPAVGVNVLGWWWWWWWWRRRRREGETNEEQDEKSDGNVLCDSAHGVHIQVLGVVVPVQNVTKIQWVTEWGAYQLDTR
jgi:hypothetical protein